MLRGTRRISRGCKLSALEGRSASTHPFYAATTTPKHLEPPSRDPGTFTALICGLPPRQSATLRGLLTGLSEKQIASVMGISPHTVHVYVKALYRSFGVGSRSELLACFIDPWAAAALGIRPPDHSRVAPDASQANLVVQLPESADRQASLRLEVRVVVTEARDGPAREYANAWAIGSQPRTPVPAG